MNVKDLKKMLKEELEINIELYDLAIELAKELYKEDKHSENYATHLIESHFENYEFYGCMPSLQAIQNEVKKRKKEFLNWKVKQEKNENKDSK